MLCALWFAGLFLFSMRRSSRSKALQDRLADSGPSGAETKRVLSLWHDGVVSTTVVAGQTSRPPLAVRLEIIRREAGFKTDMRALLMVLVGAALLLGLLIFLGSRNVV